ncbi:MAG TPA: branched-chain amino acid ABC transporter permease [Candidatus Dormibacteraeota bacterium]|jgi:branched-chain amino acid transport system permease protein
MTGAPPAAGRRRPLLPGAVALGLLAVPPLLLPDFVTYDLAYAGVYAIAILGLVLLTGFSGQISLGQGAFMAIGGYASAILVATAGWSLYLTIPVAGVLATVVGIVVGIPAARLTGIYLALATFALSLAAPALLKEAVPLTNGARGIVVSSAAPVGPLTQEQCQYYLCWGIAALLLVFAVNLVRGRFGRALVAVRDSEAAARASGINVPLYRAAAFGISAFCAGIAGALLSDLAGFVNPDSFGPQLSITVLVGAVVGGVGSMLGPVLGALFVEFLPIRAQDIPRVGTAAPAVIEGVLLILVVLVAPTGLAGLLQRAAASTQQRFSRRRTPPATGAEAALLSAELRGVAMVIEAHRAEETEVRQ